MNLSEFTALVDRFTTGSLTIEEFSIELLAELKTDSSFTLADMLTATQMMLHDGALDPKGFRQVSELLTELNIKQAMSTRGAEVPAPAHQDDETLIMPSPPGTTESDETLIMPSGGSREQTTVETIIESPTDTDETPKRQPPKKSSKATNRVKVGDVLKERFELLEKIGHGGMGMVFRARDLVRVKAQDQNPYLAIKVLSEAFKKHSRAFIALQREASKAQRLAHPNIATVYDFDHDGKTIYMTMELLHGQPFDALISQLPQGGLSPQIALRYIEDLCHGLAYAHKQSLIHCDLKPANIFLCDNGTVKLLDFGITRAFKKEKKESGDETLFDPASLKALTPAYASVEMFRGDPPDPRDDIYALACVSYELLSGVHPYKKVAAHKALELGLKPHPIKGLSRKQQKTLNKALALTRDKRTSSISSFLDGIRPAKSYAKVLAIISLVVLGIVLGSLYKLSSTQRAEDSRIELIKNIKNGDQQLLVDMLSTLDLKDDDTRGYLKYALRQEIIGYFEKRINDEIDRKKQNFNYPKAQRLLKRVKTMYPDSVTLSEAERQLEARKQKLITKLLEEYEKVGTSGKDRILEILSDAEPTHPLLIELKYQKKVNED